MIIAIVLVVIVCHPFDARIRHFTTEIGKLMLKSIGGENNRGIDMTCPPIRIPKPDAHLLNEAIRLGGD